MRDQQAARIEAARRHLEEETEAQVEQAKHYDEDDQLNNTKCRQDAGTATVLNEVQKRNRSARDEELRRLRREHEEERISAELARLQEKDERIDTVRERHAAILEQKQIITQRRQQNKLSTVIAKREEINSPERLRAKEVEIERKIATAKVLREERLERVKGDAASVRDREREALERARKLEKARKREIRNAIRTKEIVSSDHLEVINAMRDLQLQQLAETAKYFSAVAQQNRAAQEGVQEEKLEQSERKIQQAQEAKQREIENLKAALARENYFKDEWRRTLAKRAALKTAIRSEEKAQEQQEKLEAAAERREFLTFQI